MLCDGIDGAMEVRHCVTLLAVVFVGLGSKLFVVLILVAIEALGKLDLIDRVLPSGKVAFRAFNLGVHAFQRILRCGMFLNTE